MKPLLRAAALFALLILPAQAQDALPADLGARVATAYAEPATQGFVTQTAALAAGITTLCATPSPANLTKAREAFGETVAAWGRLSVLRFGPLVADNRFESIFFWPDTRGVTIRQVEAALASADPGVTNAETLAGKSVALQNLFAADYLLSGSGADALANGEPHRCAYLAALTAILHDHAEAIAAGWQPGAEFGASFRAPGADGYFRSDEEVLGELVKAIATTIEYTRSAEIGPPMGETIGDARGRRAPLWRSDLTFSLAAAQLGGLVDLLDITGLGDSLTGTRLTPFTNLHSDLDRAAETLATIALPVELAFADPAQRKRLDYVMLLLGYASETVTAELTSALGLTMGFNALDRD
jgi:predicted lipoprotein